jgi:hypothetical protein
LSRVWTNPLALLTDVKRMVSYARRTSNPMAARKMPTAANAIPTLIT